MSTELTLLRNDRPGPKTVGVDVLVNQVNLEVFSHSERISTHYYMYII